MKGLNYLVRSHVLNEGLKTLRRRGLALAVALETASLRWPGWVRRPSVVCTYCKLCVCVCVCVLLLCCLFDLSLYIPFLGVIYFVS